MVIKNLTSEMQTIKFKMVGSRDTHSMNIIPHGITILDRAMLVDKESLEGLIEVDGVRKFSKVEHTAEIVEENTEDNTSPAEVEVPVEENTEESPDKVDDSEVNTVNEDKFICSECGQEFASTRSLNSHIKREHKSEE